MNVYQIGVSIALTNTLGPALHVLSRQLMGIHTQAGQIHANFNRWATAIGGVAGIMGSFAIIGGLNKLAHAGSEVNHQLALMKIQGMGYKDIQDSSTVAIKNTGKVLTTTFSENLKHIRELRYAFGDTETALLHLETVTRANAILNAVRGGGKDQVWELVKGLEEKGLSTKAKQQEFTSYVDNMTKAVIASGGKVTPAMFFSAFKYGRTATLGWNETFITQYLPRLIQSMSTGSGGMGGAGTGGPGNALMSAFAKVIQGQMPKGAASMFEKMGLGTATHIKGSASSLTNIRGKQLFLENPYEWVQQYLVPAITQKTHARLHTPSGQLKFLETVSQMFTVRTASQIIGMMGLQGRTALGIESPFEKDARLQREAFNQRMAYDELLKNDYNTMMAAFHAQWHSFTEVVGQPLTKPGSKFLGFLSSVTTVMNKASQIAEAHPQIIEGVVQALVSLAIVIGSAGFIAIAALLGPLVGTAGLIVGLAFAIGALAAVNWETAVSGINALESSIGDFFSWLEKKMEPVTAPLNKWLHEHLPEPVPGSAPGIPGFEGLPDMSPQPQKMNYVPAGPKSSQPMQVTTILNVDGRKIAEAVTLHQVRAASGPDQGASSFDHVAPWNTSAVDRLSI